jgi:predicted metal-dependent hydrolase
MTHSATTAQTACIALPGGGEAALNIRRSRRARRVALRIVPGSGDVELVVPITATLKQGLAFAREKADWLKTHLSKMPPPVPFEDGAIIPFRDQPRQICRTDELFRGVWLTPHRLQVATSPDRLAGDVRRWLKERAREELTRRVEEKSTLLKRRFRRVTVRDTSSRWGSCSPEGDLSFSWRVIMAPDYVLDYLVAHEVAHLAEMNHSPHFWAIVYQITDQADMGRDWLRTEGANLHRYGIAPRSL